MNLIIRKIFLSFLFGWILLISWRCSPYILPGPGIVVQLYNTQNQAVLNSGFVVGTATVSNDTVTSVVVSYDGESSWRTASGTSQWKIAIPTGSSTWKQGTVHQIQVKTTTASHAFATTSFSLKKGTNLDADGDGWADMVVGAPQNGSSSQGEAFVFYGGPTGIANHPLGSGYSCIGNIAPSYCTTLYNPDNKNGALFGRSAVMVGDVNGDGYADVAVGEERGGTSNQGKTFIYYGSSNGIAYHPLGTTYTCLGNTDSNACTEIYNPDPKTNGNFGYQVMAADDLDRDGYSDFLVQAYSNGSSSVGAAYVVYGSATGPALHLAAQGGYSCNGNNTPNYCTVFANPENRNLGFFGNFLAPAGDVNSDGYPDLIINANGNGGSGQGVAYLFYGSANGFTSHPMETPYTCSGNTSPNYCSTLANPDNTVSGNLSGVAGVGDVNGDGYPDVLIAASHNGGSSQGVAYLFYGTSAGIQNHPVNVAYSCSGNVAPNYCTTINNPDDSSGHGITSVASAGDINRD
jgi:hypothetical protein